jgi:hypothetical protein
VKLIIHIGTHKTGSTALQQFLSSHPRFLAKCGIHYAASRPAIKASALVHAIRVDDRRKTQDYMISHSTRARRKGTHTLIVSAEGLYAMALVPALCRRETCPALIDRDAVFISRFAASLPDQISDVRVVGYFRRPDLFAESWYNQQVKYGSLFAGEFHEFLELIRPALLYSRHMNLWANVFGRESCTVRVYESIVSSIVDDFARHILDTPELAQFAPTRAAVNQRMSRDLLEFKRRVNRDVAYEEMALERRIFELLHERVDVMEAEPNSYQAFLAPRERAELLAGLSDELVALQTSFGVPSFPRFDLQAAAAEWTPYPGLEPAREDVLAREYRKIRARPRFRAERLFVKARGALREKQFPPMGTA